MNDQAFSIWRGLLNVPFVAGDPSSARDILKLVADRHEMTVDELLSKSRKTRFIRARWDAMYLLRMSPKLGGGRRSLPEIGRAMGGMDHTSVIHGLRRREAEFANREAVAA